jgi:hypothetical protein
LIGGPSLLGRRLLAEQPSHLLTRLMGALFNGSEIEVGQVTVRPEELALDQAEKLLELSVLRCIQI